MGEKRRRTRIDSKIVQLPEDIKTTVDTMLLDTGNTYQDISDWLSEQGFKVSKSAVGRYAVRANEATRRVLENLERTRALVAAVEADPSMDYTKASQIVAMDGLMRRVSNAEEEFEEMPLEKATRLIAQLSRVKLTEDKQRQDLKNKIELAFQGMEAEIMAVIKSDPALAGQLKDVLKKAKEKMISDD